MNIALKNKYKYLVKRLPQTKWTPDPEWYADIFVRTGPDLTWSFYRRVIQKSEEACAEAAESAILKAPQRVYLDDYVQDLMLSFKYFLLTLKPWIWNGWPLASWKKARSLFKKPPVKFEILKNWAPDLESECRRLKWYNFIFLSVSDVDWKWKYRWIRFVEPPRVSLTFFRKITLSWSWTLNEADVLYWEDLLSYLYNGLSPEDVGSRVLKPSLDETDIITIKDWIVRQ